MADEAVCPAMSTCSVLLTPEPDIHHKYGDRPNKVKGDQNGISPEGTVQMMTEPLTDISEHAEPLSHKARTTI